MPARSRDRQLPAQTVNDTPGQVDMGLAQGTGLVASVAGRINGC